MADQAVDPGGTGRHRKAAVPGPGVRPPRVFLGRQRELKELRADIARAGLDTLAGRKPPRARILLIAGGPGSGRTALAGQLVSDLARGYRDGVLRARLTEPGGEPVPVERVARDLLALLGVATPAGADAEELSGLLRTTLADRRVLLLLDDAADAEQVDALLPDNHACLVVAVARGPLTGITDVRPCTVGGLDTKSAIELLDGYAGSVRITVDPQAAETLAELCGGLPAALVLAGGWLAARPMSSVADLTKRLRAVPENPLIPADQWPLARAFRVAYEALPAGAARILRLLALAPLGAVDAQTASALAGCSVATAQSLLEYFAAAGFVREGAGGLVRSLGPAPRAATGSASAARAAATTQYGAEAGAGAGTARGPGRPSGPEEAGGEGAAGTGGPDRQYEVPGCLLPLLAAVLVAEDRPAEIQLARARMLERTVRLLHASRVATEPEGSAARRRLAGRPRALRFPSPEAAGAWLLDRQPALLAAARLAVADGDLDTLARRLVAALVRALTAHRGAEEAAPELYGLHGLVLDVAGRRGLHRERAAALLNLADLDVRTGRPGEALARYREALDAGRLAGDPYAVARAMESMGGAHQELADWPRAADWYGRALAQRLARDERADQARLYGRLGAVLTYEGRYGEALRNWRAAAAGYRRLGDLPGHARALSEVARVQEYAGRPQESLRTCEEAVDWARRAGDERLLAALQLRLADTLDRLGDPAAARLHRAAAEKLLRDRRAAEAGGRGEGEPKGGATGTPEAGGAAGDGTDGDADSDMDDSGGFSGGVSGGDTGGVEGPGTAVRDPLGAAVGAGQGAREGLKATSTGQDT